MTSTIYRGYQIYLFFEDLSRSRAWTGASLYLVGVWTIDIRCYRINLWKAGSQLGLLLITWTRIGGAVAFIWSFHQSSVSILLIWTHRQPDLPQSRSTSTWSSFVIDRSTHNTVLSSAWARAPNAGVANDWGFGLALVISVDVDRSTLTRQKYKCGFCIRVWCDFFVFQFSSLVLSSHLLFLSSRVLAIISALQILF